MSAGRATPSVSVVICAFTTDRWEELSAAVRSAARQSEPPREVIVVIDHNPALLELASQFSQDPFATLWSDSATEPDSATQPDSATVPDPAMEPPIHVVPSTGPRGLAGARNTGVALAGGDIVAFLDDDAEAEPGWLAGLLHHYADPTVIGVGGLVLPIWQRSEPAWFPPEFRWVVGCSYDGLPAATTQVRNPIGANMSFRRQEVLDAGAFATSVGRVGSTPLGCEETELSIRLTRLHPGSRILFDPAAVVHHHVPEGRGTWRYFRRRCWAEGLSKAEVTRLAGSDHALSAERAHVARALPRGILRDLRLGLTSGGRPDLQRAAASAGGLAITGAGYLKGRIVTERATRRATHRAIHRATHPDPSTTHVEPGGSYVHHTH